MKKLILGIIVSLLTTTLYAANSGVWKSSFTATADTTKNLCIDKRGFLHSVIVSSGTPNASVSIFASSATVNSTMTIINAVSPGQYIFDAVAVATNSAHTGLTYSTVGTANIQILYDCY